MIVYSVVSDYFAIQLSDLFKGKYSFNSIFVSYIMQLTVQTYPTLKLAVVRNFSRKHPCGLQNLKSNETRLL